MIFPFKTSRFLKKLFPHFIWDISTNEKEVYLTFDDGPIPIVTEWVLDILDAYDVKATFFCVGDNIRKHPSIYERIIAEGHAAGNHTFNHISGWKTSKANYLKNITQCYEIMQPFAQGNLTQKPPLFRPPYGRIKKSQAKALRGKYRVVMWDVLSGDFSKSISPEKCLHKTIKYTQKGSIVVFHDSIKTENTLRYVLPNYIEAIQQQGFTFKLL